MMKDDKKQNPTYSHKRAFYDFKILERWVAGIKLEGWEVKALKGFNGDINGSFCKFNREKNELFIVGSKISPLKEHTDPRYLTSETRDRGLLLNKSELSKIEKGLIKGITCIPLKMFVNDKGLWKIEIALAIGKKNWDKRQQIKEKDLKRHDERSNRNN